MTARLTVSAPQAPDSTHRTTQTPSNTRRANKPLMEKRRRARINQSLALLKTLILDSAKMENTKHSKLEKADILELTVRHLQRQKTLSTTSVDKYRAGFMECAREVTRFLDTPELQCGAGVGNKPIGIDPTVRQRLMRHLESCAAEISLDFSTAKVGPLKPIDTETEKRLEQLEELLVGSEEADKPDSSTVSPGDENNNSRRKTKVEKVDSSTNSPSTSNNPVSLVQVIPSRLPDGQVVFLLPSHYVQLTQGMEENKSAQEVPIDFSLRKDDGTDDKEEEVWRPW